MTTSDRVRDIHDVRSETQLELLPMVSRLDRHESATNAADTPVADDRGDRDYSDLELKILISKPQFYPPLNFSLVEDGIYRSGFPMPLNYPFIEQLHLKTIIYLGDLGFEKPADKPKKDKHGTAQIFAHYRQWIERETAIQLHLLPMESSQEPFVSSQTEAQQSLTAALQLMLDRNNFPMLIHSNKGKHRIGVLVGLMRKLLQGWCLSGIFEEYEKFALGKSEYDLECIEIWQPQLQVDMRTKPDFVRL
ncbi:Uncharacterized protein ABC855_g257 [[Candida] zeylanoides]